MSQIWAKRCASPLCSENIATTKRALGHGRWFGLMVYRASTCHQNHYSYSGGNMVLTAFDQQCLDLLNDRRGPKTISRHCFRSAVNHLVKAEKLVDIDMPMAIFRALTAEEEAATGLMHCLKACGYQNAEKLSVRNHRHKNAVIPFFRILNQFFKDYFHDQGFALTLNHVREEDEIVLRATVELMIDGKLTFMSQMPPLNFALSVEGKRFSFKKQADILLATQGVADLPRYLEQEANRRNLCLYAGPKGYVTDVRVEPKYFPAQQARVFGMLRAYQLIHPYGVQPFVQDALDAFLMLLRTLNLPDVHEKV